MRVLYVEDNPHDADLARRALARLMPEAALELAATVAAAIARLAQAPALDLVLADLKLPDGTGLDLLAHIRAHDLPLAVVILTGSGDQDAAIAALKAGADDYLTKREDYLARLPQTLSAALAHFRTRVRRGARPLQVLYAEHNPFDVDLARRHLARHASHIRLEVVVSPQEALARLPLSAEEDAPCDVVLLDYRLPGLDALDIVKVLREERGLRLPIVLITGQGNEEVAARALHLGVDDYLVKHAGYLFELPATLEKAQRQAELEREQTALRKSEAHTRLLLDTMAEAMYGIDPAGRCTFVNRSCLELLGYRDAEDLLGKRTHALFHHTLADGSPYPFEQCKTQDTLRTGQPVHVQDEILWRADGSAFPVEYWVRPVLENGRVTGAVVTFFDITARRRAEFAQQVRNEVLDQIIARRPLPAILANIAHRLEAIHPESRVSILLLDRHSGRLTVGAAPSLPAFYNDAVEGLMPGPGKGSCGVAAHLGEIAIAEDLSTHPDWAPYRELTARAGLGACWSHPFKDATGQVLGTFGTYYAAPRAPGADELELIAEFARLSGIAVQQTRLEAARLQSEQRFQAIFEQSPLLKGIVAQDGTLLLANRTELELVGARAEDVVGRTFWDASWWQEQSQQSRLRQAIARAAAGAEDYFEASHRKADGSTMFVEFHASPIRIGDEIQVLATGIDITEHKRAEDALRQSAAVFASSHDGVMITDLDGRILSANPAFTEITGYAEAEVLGLSPNILQSGRHEPDFYQALWASLREAGYWKGEIWNRRKNGEVYPEWLTISTVRDDQGRPACYVAVFSDISQIKEAESHLQHLAHYDPLTQLPNRLLLFSRLEHSIALARRDGKQLALLMLDLDHFKIVNDSFGHLAGDELLQKVAERLASRLRGMDTVSRLGGDEFTVQLEDLAHAEDAARVAEEIIAALSQPWQLSNGAEIRIGASVGISLYPQHGSTAQELLQQADTALYRAKAKGRGGFKYFSEELTLAARARIDLEARLRRALECAEFRLHFQPQVDIASGRILGAEALVRWQDSAEGLVAPGRFIPVAEETGLITPIGNWVLQEACRQGRRWLDAGLPPLKLAVNLSPNQFLHSDIEKLVADALAATGYPATLLELELTESALMTREQEAIQILHRLRALGVRLAIDDFGTGYSSLAYLKHFPLDVLKIDKSFIDDIPHDPNDCEITATIIAMAHTLHLKVLAEGVETPAQLEFLRAQGCDAYQGYLLSAPVAPDAFAELLAAHTETQ